MMFRPVKVQAPLQYVEDRQPPHRTQRPSSEDPYLARQLPHAPPPPIESRYIHQGSLDSNELYMHHERPPPLMEPRRVRLPPFPRDDPYYRGPLIDSPQIDNLRARYPDNSAPLVRYVLVEPQTYICCCLRIVLSSYFGLLVIFSCYTLSKMWSLVIGTSHSLMRAICVETTASCVGILERRKKKKKNCLLNIVA